MFNQQDKLDIFENFRVDRTLPKYTRPDPDDEDMMEESSFIGSRKRMSKGINISSGSINTNWSGNDLQVVATWMEDGSWPWPWRWMRRVRWLWALVSGWFQRKRQGRQQVMSVEEFFRSLKNSSEELTIVDQRAKGYEAALRRAKESGQQALYEQLEQGLQAVRAEAQIVALGLGRYLDEARLVEFVKKAKRGLRLDWVANFTRHVPDDVLDTKRAADERGVFDNYVVLHYDPQKKSWAETQEEKEAERRRRSDPILFGLIEGRRRLYFVGDWVDEFCDLTLDQVADLLGQDAVGRVE